MKVVWANPEKIGVLIVKDGIPHYVDAGEEYEAAIAAGPEEFSPSLQFGHPISQEVDLSEERAGMVASAFQARAALYQAGLLDEVERLIAGSENFVHRLAWERAVEFRRDSPTINFLAGSVGLDDKSLDELFRLAMSIRA